MPRFIRKSGTVGYGSKLPAGAKWDTSNKRNSIPGDGARMSDQSDVPVQSSPKKKSGGVYVPGLTEIGQIGNRVGQSIAGVIKGDRAKPKKAPQNDAAAIELQRSIAADLGVKMPEQKPAAIKGDRAEPAQGKDWVSIPDDFRGQFNAMKNKLAKNDSPEYQELARQFQQAEKEDREANNKFNEVFSKNENDTASLKKYKSQRAGAQKRRKSAEIKMIDLQTNFIGSKLQSAKDPIERRALSELMDDLDRKRRFYGMKSRNRK